MPLPGDHESLRLHMPPGCALPARFGELVASGIEGSRLDDHYVEDGTRAAHTFVGFLGLSDGSRIGWWRPNGEELERARVILLGSEGQLHVLANDFAEFLTLPEFSDDDFDALPAPSAELEHWFAEWSSERRRRAAADPSRRELAEAVASIVGLPPRRTERRFLDVVVDARACRAFRNYVGERPVEMSPDFEARLRAFREADARELPEAGLWFRAGLELAPDGSLSVRREYLELPNPREIVLDEAGVLEDLRRAPRSRYWMPAWLSALGAG